MEKEDKKGRLLTSWEIYLVSRLLINSKVTEGNVIENSFRSPLLPSFYIYIQSNTKPIFLPLLHDSPNLSFHHHSPKLGTNISSLDYFKKPLWPPALPLSIFNLEGCFSNENCASATLVKLPKLQKNIKITLNNMRVHCALSASSVLSPTSCPWIQGQTEGWVSCQSLEYSLLSAQNNFTVIHFLISGLFLFTFWIQL